MIIKCNINEETFKIDYSGKFILVDYKNYFLKHAEKFYVDLKYDGDKIQDMYTFLDNDLNSRVLDSLLYGVPKWT